MIPPQFRSHELWELLDKVKQNVESYDPTVAIDDEQRDIIFNQVPAVVEAVLRHRTNSSAYYSRRLLDSMIQPCSQLRSHIENSQNNLGNILHVENSLESIQSQLAKWPSTFALRGGAVEAAVDQFESLIASYESRIAFLESEIASKNDELSERDKTHSEDLENLRLEVIVLKGQIELAGADLKSQENAISGLTSQHNETFTEAQERRQLSWEEWLEKRGEGYDSAVEEQIEKIKDDQIAGAAIFSDIEGMRDQTEAVASKAVEGVLAKNYNSYAHRDWVLGIIRVIAGLVGIATAGGMLLWAMADLSPDTETTWQWTVLKITVTVLISAGSTVSFAFARLFFAQSAESKRLELELRAINPFLANLEDKTLADSAKVKFVERAFGQSQRDEKVKTSEDGTLSAEVLSLAQKVIDMSGRNN